MLRNPSLNPGRAPHVSGQPRSRDYFGTQQLAKYVRGHYPPDPRPEGIKAPGIREKSVAGYKPHQLVLFVLDSAVQQQYQHRSTLLVECELTFQFLQLEARKPVTAQTVDIDWCNPEFRIGGAGAATIPVYSPRPHAQAILPNRWNELAIQFS